MLRTFRQGRPKFPCRPFLPSELQHLQKSLFKNAQSSSLGIFVTGIPASGKSSTLSHVLAELNLPPIDTYVNLDMDLIRSFHREFTNAEPYEDLIPWFNETSNAEEMLYKDSDGLVQTMLRKKLSFVLPVHSKDTVAFVKYVQDEFGYDTILISLKIDLKTALKRAGLRANQTGRYTSPEYIRQSNIELNELNEEMIKVVHNHYEFDNCTEDELPHPC